jgi:hypothetical protein
VLGAWLVAILAAYALLSEGVVLELPGTKGKSPLAAIVDQHRTLLGALVAIAVTARRPRRSRRARSPCSGSTGSRRSRRARR